MRRIQISLKLQSFKTQETKSVEEEVGQKIIMQRL